MVGARQPVWWGAEGLGAGAEKEWKPRERRRDLLWALMARDLFLLSTVLGAHGEGPYLFQCR